MLNLSLFEERCLIACIAPEIDTKYEKVYGYFENDTAIKNPSINLLMKIFLSTEDERIEARKLFSLQAPLVRLLLENGNDLSDNCIPLISRHLKLDDWVVNYLLDINILDSRLIHVAELIQTRERGYISLIMKMTEYCILSTITGMEGQKEIKYFTSMVLREPVKKIMYCQYVSTLDYLLLQQI